MPSSFRIVPGSVRGLCGWWSQLSVMFRHQCCCLALPVTLAVQLALPWHLRWWCLHFLLRSLLQDVSQDCCFMCVTDMLMHRSSGFVDTEKLCAEPIPDEHTGHGKQQVGTARTITRLLLGLRLTLVRLVSTGCHSANFTCLCIHLGRAATAAAFIVTL